MILLTGCGTLAKSSDVAYIVKCPPLVEYTQAARDKAADELALMPPGAATLAFIADYATLRARCRALGKLRENR